MNLRARYQLRHCPVRSLTFVLLIATVSADFRPVLGQNAEKPEIPTISNEPRFIDRGQFLPPKLAMTATVDLRERSYLDLIDWLRQEIGLTVVIENSEIQEKGVLLADIHPDWLVQAPVYYLLDRLQQDGLGWYYDNEILFITSLEKAQNRQKSVAYPLGELLDQKFSAEALVGLIRTTISPESWDDNQGDGRSDLIGDTLFVLNQPEVHLQIQGLLSALRQPGRQTFVSDSAANSRLRDQLETVLAAEYRDMPLTDILSDLGKRADIDIRLVQKSARTNAIRARKPLNVSVGEQTLKTILTVVLEGYDLVPMVRHGVMWIGPRDDSQIDFRTAMYDVRDLCRDDSESQALAEAIQSQMPDIWSRDTGDAELEFARPGMMVVWCTTDDHRDLLTLLERYRDALRNSKPRAPAAAKADEIVTRYYRLHSDLAANLLQWLPQKIAVDSWQGAGKENSIGTIELIESVPEVAPLMVKGVVEEGSQIISSRKTLVIHQRESVHDEIVTVIRRIESGDPESRLTREEQEALLQRGGGFGGGGLGGAGGGGGKSRGTFGGGIFSVPSRRW